MTTKELELKVFKDRGIIILPSLLAEYDNNDTLVNLATSLSYGDYKIKVDKIIIAEYKIVNSDHLLRFFHGSIKLHEREARSVPKEVSDMYNRYVDYVKVYHKGCFSMKDQPLLLDK